jgi:acyl-CoA thioesterase
MQDFPTSSTPQLTRDATYTWSVPDGWQQGRGAFGGLVLAALIRAFEAEAHADEQPLRAVNATLCGPVLAEEAEIGVEMLRAGSNTSTLSARLTQADSVRAHATAMFGQRRVDDGDWNNYDTPEIGDWQEAGVAELPAPLAPTFTQHIEFRPQTGFPFTGATEREVSGWVRPRRPGERRDAAYLACCMDAYWPAAFAAVTSPRPMATVTFAMEFPGTFDGLDLDAPLFFRSTCPVSRDGYMVEFRELFGADGRLLALNQQTICIIK